MIGAEERQAEPYGSEAKCLDEIPIGFPDTDAF